MMHAFGYELRLAFRTLRKNPILTTVTLLSLGIGIGANTAIFTLMDRLILRSMPVQAPEQLVLFAAPGGRSGYVDTSYGDAVTFSWPKYRALRDQSKSVFQDLLARFPFEASVSTQASTERAQGELISGNYFSVLGVRPALGRLIEEQDTRAAGSGPVAVLSHGYWMRRLGGKADVLNQTLIVNGQALTIVGVAQAGFQSIGAGEAPAVFVPITMVSAMRLNTNLLDQAHAYWLNIFGRLQPGIDQPHAEAAIAVVWSRVLAADVATLPGNRPGSREQYLARKLQLRDGSGGISAVRGGFADALYLLMGMVGMVLLIACANVANLLLGRAAARSKEIAIRMSLGASRSRLIRHLLAESMLLALGGGAVGVIIASWAGALMLRLVPSGVPIAGITGDPDGRILLFTLGVSLLTGLLFGCVPAIRATRPDLAPILKEPATPSSGSHARFRKMLVAGQVAISILLLGAAAIFAHSLYNLSALNPGFRAEQVVTLSIDPSLNGYPADRSLRLFDELGRALAAIPGVSGASSAELPLLTDSVGISAFRISGYEADGNRFQLIHRNTVGAGFFSLLGIPLIAGREFQATDVMASLRVAVINETVARKFFEGRNPIGQHLVQGSNPPVDYEIVGVVKDSKYDNLREAAKPFAYFAAAQDRTPGTMTFYVRTASSAETMAPALRQLVRGFDVNLPIEGPRTLRSQIMESVFLDRMVAALAAAFAGLATVLAAVGLYGVIAWAITRRRREIGIRMALGARPTDVMRMVLREVLWLGLAGMALAIPAWFAGARLLGSTLFHVSPNDPLALAAAVVVLGIVAATAGAIPAFRASRIDPNSAIRYE